MTVKLFDMDYVTSNSVRYYSSAQTAYPNDNIYDKVRRSKVWRSLNFFTFTNEATGSGTTLTFREAIADGGTNTDLTTSVLTATYTTQASLATAIQTALNNATGSVLTYTVEYDLTYNKFHITATGQFRMMFATGLSPYIAGMLGYTATDRNYTSSLYADLSVMHQYEYLRWDMGTPVNPECFIAIGLYGEPLKLTSGATILLQANATNSWGSPAYSEVVPYSTEGLLLYRAGGLHTTALRYWRLKIIDQTNTYGYIELSKVALTDAMTFTRGGVQYPFSETVSDLSDIITTNSGQTLVNSRAQVKTFGLEFNGLTIADKEMLDQFFKDYGTSNPFFALLDSESIFSSEPVNQLRYCKLTGDYSTSLDMPYNWSASFSIREEI